MRTNRTRPFIVAFVIALGALATTAAVAQGARPDKGKATVTLHMTIFEPFDQGTTHEIDGGDPGFGPGDLILEHHPVFDADSGAERGALVRTLTVVDAYPDEDFLFSDSATAKLDDGEIHWAGAHRFSEVAAGTAVAPISGGTQRYERATGTVTGELGERDGSDGVHLTFDLTVPR